jgi:hypothetical protein
MSTTVKNRARTLLTTIAGTLAIIDLVAIALLMTGSRRSVGLGFRLLRPQDVFGAAEVGAALCGIVAVSAWRRRWLRRAGVIGAIAMLLLALSVDSARARRTFPVSDGALIESYTLLATQGRLVYGPYSRYGWHHPGPIYFWTAAPFYGLADHKTGGLYVGVMFINMASIVAAVWVVARFASPSLTVTMLIALAGYVWRAREILLSAWNPHVPIMPAVALTAMCAAIAAGEVTLLPLAAVFASFAAQTYVGLVPFSVGLSAVAVIVATARSRIASGIWADPRTRRLLNLTACLLVVLWSGPIAEQMTHTPGNLTRIWRFFGEAHDGPTLGQAFIAWADNVAGIFLPAFRFRGGGIFRPSESLWPLVWAPLQLLLLAPAILVLAKRRSFDAAFAATTLAGLIVAFWSVTRVVGSIPEYGMVWITAIGTLGTVALTSAGIALVADATGVSPPLPSWAIKCICALAVVTCGAIACQIYPDTGPVAQTPLTRSEREVRSLFENVRAFLKESGAGRPLLRIRGDTWSTAAGLVFQLQLAGIDFAVERSSVFLFTDEFAADGTEDAEVTLSTGSLHSELSARSGNVVLAATDSFSADAILVSQLHGP